ncbi:MAG: hypothetical protein EBZ48_07865 [Proteobacteria bacterium]|nr:hypothetical protein [Pseudomonadota bacterium]
MPDFFDGRRVADRLQQDVEGRLKNKADQEVDQGLKDHKAQRDTNVATAAKAAAVPDQNSQHDGFLPPAAPAQAPDRSVQNLGSALEDRQSNQDRLENAITAVLSGPDGESKVQEMLSNYYATGNGASMEKTAKALQVAAEKLGMSEADFQKLTSTIAYNATSQYIQAEMQKEGRFDFDTEHIQRIKGNLRFEWSGDLKNYKQVDQAVKDAVRDGVYDIVNSPHKGAYENRAAYQLASEFRLGSEVLKPDTRLQQELQINQIIFRERRPGEAPGDKVAELKALQAQMKDTSGNPLSDGEMHKLIEEQVKEHLKSAANKDALAQMDPDKARELHADLSAIKSSYYFRAEKLLTNIGDAQTILENNFEHAKPWKQSAKSTDPKQAPNAADPKAAGAAPAAAAKPEVKADPKPEAKPDAKPEVKAEAKPEAKPDPDKDAMAKENAELKAKLAAFEKEKAEKDKQEADKAKQAEADSVKADAKEGDRARHEGAGSS